MNTFPLFNAKVIELNAKMNFLSSNTYKQIMLLESVFIIS